MTDSPRARVYGGRRPSDRGGRGPGIACDPKAYNRTTSPEQWARFVLRHRAQVCRGPPCSATVPNQLATTPPVPSKRWAAR
jgi:hypothetical protein